MLALLGLAPTAQAQASIPVWTLSPAPTLTIQDDGTPATQIESIMGVGRLWDGGIVIANRGGTNDIRIFDARVSHVATFGRTGEGPGEFRRIEWMGQAGDPAWIYDSGLQRMTAVHLV